MKPFRKFALTVGALAVLTWGSQACANLIDNELGDLNSWLKNTPSGSADDWAVKDGLGIKSQIDDWDKTGNGFLDPGWGGQAYDAEAIFVALDSDFLHVAIVTGLSPNERQYPAGDIAIDLSYDVNASSQSYDMAIVVQDHDGWTAGQLLDVTDWDYGLWNDSRVQGSGSEFYYNHPTRADAGDVRTTGAGASTGGLISYDVAKYDGNTYGQNSTGRSLGEYDRNGKDAHYLIEALIPRDLFKDDTGKDLLAEGAFFVHWTMGCNNDFVGVDPVAFTLSNDGGSVPVAPAWSLMFLGLAGLLGSRKRA
jgi:hypothetical protein